MSQRLKEIYENYSDTELEKALKEIEQYEKTSAELLLKEAEKRNIKIDKPLSNKYNETSEIEFKPEDLSANNTDSSISQSTELQFCTKCGLKLNKDTIFCPKCGTHKLTIEENKYTSMDNYKTEILKQMVSNQSIGNTVNTMKKQQRQVTITILITIILFVSLIAVCIINLEPASNLSDTLASTLSITEEEIQTITNILEKCEVEGYNNFIYDSALDDTSINEKGYRLKQSNYIINMYIIDNKISSLILEPGNVLYQSGQQIAKLSDFTISSDEQDNARAIAEKTVRDVLVSPSTAKFPFMDWKYGKENNEIIVQSYVDSQNAFGATIRSNFQVKIAYGQMVTSLIIDGKECIK